MRRLLGLLLGAAVALAVGGAANAAQMTFDGTLFVRLGSNPPIQNTATGVATVNNSSGTGHLNTLRLAAGLSGNLTVNITDPNVPTVATLIHNQVGIGTTATLKPISGGGPLTAKTLPIAGNTRICILLLGCTAWLDILHTANGTRGMGIGGIVTVNGLGSGLRVSIMGAPWTVATAKMTAAFTTNAMIPPADRATETRTWTGVVHGPASGTSSTAQASGVVQLVSANRVVTTLMTPSNHITLPNILTLHFVPEPGLMLLLGSGVAGLALLGRNRMRR